MKAGDDDWRVWRWTVLATVFAIAVAGTYRISREALEVASKFVDAYEHAHSSHIQETTTDYPVGDTRQVVRTERDTTEKLENWIDRHDTGVISSREAARRRGIALQAKDEK